MNQPAIAARLLTLLASGGTLKRTIADLPMFKTQIKSALDWMKTASHCSAPEISERATRLREAVHRKDRAIRYQDFDLAANLRAEECEIFESFKLGTPPAGTTTTILNVSIDEQTRNLAALLSAPNANQDNAADNPDAVTRIVGGRRI